MRKMPEIKVENGEVKSIDGIAIPKTKLYMHYIVFLGSSEDFSYTFLIDDYPNSYTETPMREKYSNTSLPLYGMKISSGAEYQYTRVKIAAEKSITKYYMRANLEKNEIYKSYETSFGSFIKSDTVTPLN